MKFTNVIQRIGFFISKEILKTPADVTDAIKTLSDYAFLPSAESDEVEEEHTLRLELTTKDKRQSVVINGTSINVIRYKMADDELLNPVQQHLDTAMGILEKLKVQFVFNILNIAIESDYILDATDEVAKSVYKKLNVEDDVPAAWRFNRLYKRRADIGEGIDCMEHVSCLRDEIQLVYEEKSTDRIILEFTWGTVIDSEPSIATISECFTYCDESGRQAGRVAVLR